MDGVFARGGRAASVVLVGHGNGGEGQHEQDASDCRRRALFWAWRSHCELCETWKGCYSCAEGESGMGL